MKTWHFSICICFGASAFLLSSSEKCSAAEPLNAHLQPLSGYIGTWKWHWKNEHGEAKENQSIVAADPSGAFLIDQAQDDSEFNIYYWEPESKCLATIGFTADGDHGWSTVLIRGQRWVEQSFGYDDQGKLRTHIDQWQWNGNDSGVYQETHIFRNGAPEPDDMKLGFERTAVDSSQGQKAVESAPLNEHLKPLARLAGKWRVHSAGPNGTGDSGQLVIESKARGNLLVQRAVGLPAAALVSGITIFYWRAESSSLGAVNLQADGTVRRAHVEAKDGRWCLQATGATATGHFQTAFGQLEWVNENTLKYREQHRFEQGEPLADSVTLTYERVKD